MTSGRESDGREFKLQHMQAMFDLGLPKKQNSQPLCTRIMKKFAERTFKDFQKGNLALLFTIIVSLTL